MTSKITSIRNAGLEAPELTRLRAGLLDQRSFRHDQLRDIVLAEPLDSRHAGAGQVQVDHQLAATAWTVLVEIDDALVRMHNGTYGSCRACSSSIAIELLLICPQARYCARCHQLNESGR